MTNTNKDVICPACNHIVWVKAGRPLPHCELTGCRCACAEELTVIPPPADPPAEGEREELTTAELLALLNDVPVRYGLRQQGHFDRVTEMIREGRMWTEIGAEIGWQGEAVKQWYAVEAADEIMRLRTPAPPNGRGVEEDVVGPDGENYESPLDRDLSLRVYNGDGPVMLCVTDDGDIGVFFDTGDAAKSKGRGDTAFEALHAALRYARGGQ